MLLHLQDAAAMRLRTVNKNRLAGLVRRRRSAKVQLHVLVFHTHSNHFEAPTDLEGLKDGTAATLATSLDRAYRRVVDEALAPAARAAGGQVWLKAAAATGRLTAPTPRRRVRELDDGPCTKVDGETGLSWSSSSDASAGVDV